jgi:hypothetical protein
MKTSSVYGWLLLSGAVVLSGCNLFPHLNNTKEEKNEKEPLSLPGAPNKYGMRVSQFVFFSDVELRRDAPLFKDLANLREQVHRELRLPPSEREVLVYLFENKERYENFIHANHPKLPDRRAFFVAQAVRTGGTQDLMVYTYSSDNMQRDLRHELTHAMLHSVLKGVPIWLDEGLAEYFEVPAGQNGVNPKHLEALRKPGVRFDLDRLERLDEVHQMLPPEYRESWAWVHLMLRSTPQANKALMSYLQDLRTTANPGPLHPRLATAFPALDNALDAHLAQLERALPRNRSAQR